VLLRLRLVAELEDLLKDKDFNEEAAFTAQVDEKAPTQTEVRATVDTSLHAYVDACVHANMHKHCTYIPLPGGKIGGEGKIAADVFPG
jgi:hypothetical protein